MNALSRIGLVQLGCIVLVALFFMEKRIKMTRVCQCGFPEDEHGEKLSMSIERYMELKAMFGDIACLQFKVDNLKSLERASQQRSR